MRWVRLSKYKRIELKLGPSGPNGAKWLVAQKSSHVADANPRMRALHAAAPTNADVFLETHSVTLILNYESIRLVSSKPKYFTHYLVNLFFIWMKVKLANDLT